MTSEEAFALITAAEAVASLGKRVVTVALPTEHRALEPWVMELTGTEASISALPGHFTFSPLHQRPTSATGTMGVDMAQAVIAAKCPGMFVGFYHPDGDEAVERWVLSYPRALTEFLITEIERAEDEMANNDFLIANPGMELTEERMQLIHAHVRTHRESLRDWINKIRGERLFTAKSDLEGHVD